MFGISREPGTTYGDLWFHDHDISRMLVSIVQHAQPVEVDVQVPIRDTFLTRDLAPSPSLVISAVLDPLSLILAYPDFSSHLLTLS